MPSGIEQKEASNLALFGLTPEDFAADEDNLAFAVVGIWPENWLSFQLFSAMQTQWRTGMNGATGLDYNVLNELWRRLKIPIADRDYLFDDLRHMEITALNQMSENKPSE
jgi:Phage related hypothetical protein (DUF1799)